MNLVRTVLDYAGTQHDAVALIDGPRSISYGELGRLVAKTAGHFRALGVSPGERVAVCLKDSWRYVVALLAIGYCGAVFAPLDWRARSTEKTRLAEWLKPKLILAEPGQAIETSYPVIEIDAAWDEAIERAEPYAGFAGDGDAPFVISSTSGTTGLPKFSAATHRQLYFNLQARAEQVPLPQHCRHLSTAPLHFSAGRLSCFFHLYRGDTVILHSALLSAADYVELALRHRANSGYVVPMTIRQLIKLAAGGGPILPFLDALVTGGSPLAAQEKQEAARCLTPNFYERYSTSTTGPISILRPADLAGHAASVGRPHSFAEIEIVDEQGEPLGPNEAGSLRYRGPSLGYGLGGPGGYESSTEGFRNGWYYTGEIAALDGDGYLYLKGRISDVIIRGAAKIFPAEIEAVLQDHPAIAEAAVIGHAGTSGEEEAVAFLVARQPITTGEIVAHCRLRLTPYKIPGTIRFIASLPRNTGGKVNKPELAKMLSAEEEKG
jgi:long-chain acyl-CoA synthetase